MTIREFLRAVWDGKYYVLASLVVVLGVAVYYARQLTPEFEATSIVQVASLTATGDNTSQNVSIPVDPTVVTGPDVTASAQKRLAAEGVKTSDYSVTAASGGTNLVSITADAPNAALAETVANAYAQAYIDYLPTVVSQQVAQLKTRQNALNDRLTDVEARLAKAPKDPLALAELTAIVTQFTAFETQSTGLGSLVPPGKLQTSATTAVALGLSKQTILAVALLAGLVAGIGLALARRGLNFNIRSAGEAARLSEVPVLAELFDVRPSYRKARRTGALPIAERAASPFTESIRELRTSMRIAASGQHVAILVTAADSVAPRGFIAANLAASWALSGQQVIVFAGDMRRSGLERILPQPEDWSGDESSLRPTRIPNLSIYLPDTQMDPADFLATSALRQLVEDLRDEADVLVIDAPPVLAAADATILGGYATSAVMVASIGKTDRAVIREATARLITNSVPLAGLAVAGASGSRRMSYAATYGGASSRQPWYRRLLGRSQGTPRPRRLGSGDAAQPDMKLPEPGDTQAATQTPAEAVAPETMAAAKTGQAVPVLPAAASTHALAADPGGSGDHLDLDDGSDDRGSHEDSSFDVEDLIERDSPTYDSIDSDSLDRDSLNGESLDDDVAAGEAQRDRFLRPRMKG